MPTFREKIATELRDLLQQGKKIVNASSKTRDNRIRSEYQKWYTRSLAAIRELAPDRLNEFVNLYGSGEYNCISVYLLSEPLADYVFTSERLESATRRFGQQVLILESAAARLNDILVNVKGLVQAARDQQVHVDPPCLS